MKKLIISLIIALFAPFCNAVAANGGGDDSKNLLLFTGSSTMDLWKSTIATDFSEFNVVNTGISGINSAVLLRKIDTMVFAYCPSQIVIYIGDNDAGMMSTDDFAVNIVRYVDTISARYSDIHIVLVSVKPSPSRERFFEKYRLFNAKMLSMSEERKNVDFVDFWTPLLVPDVDSYFREDKLHLNAKGYEMLTGLVKAKLYLPSK